MITADQLKTLAGTTAVGTDGKIGKVVDVYESTAGPQATFVTVATGLFGSNASFVPLQEADLRGGELVLPYDKALVKDAPRVDRDEELTSVEEERLYQHYRLVDDAVPVSGTGRHGGETAVPRGTDRKDVDGDGVFDDVQGTAVGRDTSGLTTDDAMTRSEEHLKVGTQRREAGRARLRKYVTTETETVTVPVSKERVTLEREPITDANAGNAYDGPAISEEEHEVVLTEERPVVAKQAVPVERVRLGKEQVTETVQVTEQVRKEQIETDGVTGVDTDRR